MKLKNPFKACGSCTSKCSSKKNKENQGKTSIPDDAATALGGNTNTFTLFCNNCSTTSSFSPMETIICFVCPNCRFVNRVVRNPLGNYLVSTVVDDIPSYQSNLAISMDRTDVGGVLNQNGIEQSIYSNILPPCNVCLDSVGDVILFDCAHGGICEDCAKHIYSNLAVGGAHCPRCRENICKIVRITEVHSDVIKGRELSLPVKKVDGPPKVATREEKKKKKKK